jgi:hypothetical protein
VYENAAAKGRQALLRFRANQIANYEALNQLHFPPIKRDPKYIYYIGRSKNFETWYENRKNDGAIFEDFEKKSTFTKFVFEEKDYDKFSIWKYDNVTKTDIENIERKKNDLKENIEDLINKLEKQKNSDNTDGIDVNTEIEKLKKMMSRLNKN